MRKLRVGLAVIAIMALVVPSAIVLTACSGRRAPASGNYVLTTLGQQWATELGEVLELIMLADNGGGSWLHNTVARDVDWLEDIFDWWRASELAMDPNVFDGLTEMFIIRQWIDDGILPNNDPIFSDYPTLRDFIDNYAGPVTNSSDFFRNSMFDYMMENNTFAGNATDPGEAMALWLEMMSEMAIRIQGNNLILSVDLATMDMPQAELAAVKEVFGGTVASITLPFTMRRGLMVFNVNAIMAEIENIYTKMVDALGENNYFAEDAALIRFQLELMLSVLEFRNDRNVITVSARLTRDNIGTILMLVGDDLPFPINPQQGLAGVALMVSLLQMYPDAPAILNRVMVEGNANNPSAISLNLLQFHQG